MESAKRIQAKKKWNKAHYKSISVSLPLQYVDDFDKALAKTGQTYSGFCRDAIIKFIQEQQQ